MDTKVIARLERILRREALVRIAERHPDWSYARIAAALGAILRPAVSRQRAAIIIRAEMLRRDPTWRKPDPAWRTYRCSVCDAEFRGETGYSGRTARRCPEHRRREGISKLVPYPVDTMGAIGYL